MDEYMIMPSSRLSRSFFTIGNAMAGWWSSSLSFEDTLLTWLRILTWDRFCTAVYAVEVNVLMTTL